MYSKSNKPISLIIDTDNAYGMPVRDIDDGVALLIAFAAPQVDIKAIVASSCNCRAWESARNTLHLLKKMQRSDVAVGLGAETPLAGDRQAHHAYLEQRSKEDDGAQLWASIPPVPEYDLSMLPDGAQLIIDTVRAYPNLITLVALGSFTNLAIALRQAPEIAPLIKEVIHMGGSFKANEDELPFIWDTADIPEEVWDTTLRFNTWYDKQATVEVLQSGIPVRFITANVTSHFYLENTHLQELKALSHSSLGQYVIDGIEPWLKWSMENRKVVGAHMHDPLTVLYLLDPGLCAFREMKADLTGFLGGYELFPQNENGLWKSLKSNEEISVQVAVNLDVAKAQHNMLELLKIVMNLE